MELHEKLQELRKQKGLTQEELAAQLFVSRTAISKWESGRGFPNIESLKALSRFFGVSLDELLSGDELLTIAEHDHREAENNLHDLVFGLLDSGMALLLFLPLFGQHADRAVRDVSLLALSGVSATLKAAYILAVSAMILLGVLTLSLQNCRRRAWMTGKRTVSLIGTAASTCLFILGRQPYAALLTFVFLAIKGIVLLKRR